MYSLFQFICIFLFVCLLNILFYQGIIQNKIHELLLLLIAKIVTIINNILSPINYCNIFYPRLKIEGPVKSLLSVRSFLHSYIHNGIYLKSFKDFSKINIIATFYTLFSFFRELAICVKKKFQNIFLFFVGSLQKTVSWILCFRHSTLIDVNYDVIMKSNCVKTL